jgi:hypothetical protein
MTVKKPGRSSPQKEPCPAAVRDMTIDRYNVNTYPMDVRADTFGSAKSHLFDTSSWGPVWTAPALQGESGVWRSGRVQVMCPAC